MRVVALFMLVCLGLFWLLLGAAEVMHGWSWQLLFAPLSVYLGCRTLHDVWTA